MRHGITLGLDIDADLGSIVADERKVRQILLNLLSNAIKFGRGKPIQVITEPVDDGGVAIHVIDQGEGISETDQERIFQEFVQLGKTQLQDGTGLGLPISRRLAELLHGSLTVTSTLGQGSTFRLELPQNAEPQRSLRLVDQELHREPSDERAPPSADLHDERDRRVAIVDTVRG
jgi:signal transduction histidine kinase